MFRQFKKIVPDAIESTQSVVQKPMRTIKWFFSISQYVYTLSGPMRGSRGGTGGPDPPPPPWKITKIWIFLAKLNWIP